MHNQSIARFLFASLVALFFVGSFGFLLFQFWQYDTLVQTILDGLHRQDLYTILTTKFFTPTKYEQVKMLASIGSGLSFLMMLGLWYKREKAIHALTCFVQDMAKAWQGFKKTFQFQTKTNRKLFYILLFFIFARSIYYATAYFIQFDEAWNYNIFLHQHLFYSVVAYNNYPLHNLVTWFFVHGFPNSLLAMRMPSILIGICNCVLVFCIVKKLLVNEISALFAMIIFACLPVSVFYMLYARGVLFEVFFALLVIYFIIQFVEKGFSLKFIFYLALLNALGTYSMLSHPYFILMSGIGIFFILLFQKKGRQLKYSVFYVLLSIACSALLLLPMYLGTGFSLGLEAAMSHSRFLSLHHVLPFHCYSDFITGSPYTFYALFFVNICFVWYGKTNAERIFYIACLNLFLLSSVFIIPLFTHTYAVERAYSFLVIVPVMSIGMLFHILSLQWKYVLGLSSVVVLSILSHTHDYLNWSKQLDKEVRQLSELYIAHQITEVYNTHTNYYYFVPGIEYYLNVQHQSMLYTTSLQSSKRYKANGASKPCIVADSTFTDTNYFLLYRLKKMEVFIQKKTSH